MDEITNRIKLDLSNIDYNSQFIKMTVIIEIKANVGGMKTIQNVSKHVYDLPALPHGIVWTKNLFVISFAIRFTDRRTTYTAVLTCEAIAFRSSIVDLNT